MTLSDNIILKINNLNFAYKKNIQILNNINLNIKKSEITSLCGSSGIGKSTLFYIISLLFREFDEYCVSGNIWFKDEDKTIDLLEVKKDFWKIRRKIVYIAQEPSPLPLSIYKNISFPLKLINIKDKKLIENKVIDSLKKVNLYEQVKHRLNESAQNLSVGQKQKLCIARALVLEPEIILLDEPTASLDKNSMQIIENLIIKLKEYTTVIMISHDKSQVERISDYVYNFEN
jgi:phosphate transport system ATP-binding protein